MKQKTIFETNTGLQFANKEMAELAEKIQSKLWNEYDVMKDLEQEDEHEFFLSLKTWREIERISVIKPESKIKVFLMFRDSELYLATDMVLAACKKGVNVELDCSTMYISFQPDENARTPEEQFFWFLENSGNIFKEEK